MKGGYRPKGTVLRVVTLEEIVKQFQDLSKEKPDFNITEAIKAKIWGTHVADKLEKRFNEVRILAGLKARKDVGNYQKRTPEEKLADEFIPKETPVKPLELTKRCLRIFELDGGAEKQCPKMVPRGQFFCPKCRKWKNEQ